MNRRSGDEGVEDEYVSKLNSIERARGVVLLSSALAGSISLGALTAHALSPGYRTDGPDTARVFADAGRSGGPAGLALREDGYLDLHPRIDPSRTARATQPGYLAAAMGLGAVEREAPSRPAHLRRSSVEWVYVDLGRLHP